MRVYHGQVNILGCVISEANGWQRVISDPRKNMLIDIKNTNNDDESVKDFPIKLDERTIVANVKPKETVIGIKEYKKYSDAEEQQFLIPSDIRILNFSTAIDARKSIFNMNRSWSESIEGISQSLGENTTILINGVINSGKSTFASCLINRILS